MASRETWAGMLNDGTNSVGLSAPLESLSIANGNLQMLVDNSYRCKSLAQTGAFKVKATHLQNQTLRSLCQATDTVCSTPCFDKVLQQVLSSGQIKNDRVQGTMPVDNLPQPHVNGDPLPL